MKTHIKQIAFSLLIIFTISCQTNKKEEQKENTISSTIEKAKEKTLNNPNQDGETQKALYKALEKKTPLTNDQLFAILPEDIHGNKPSNNYALQVSSKLASGIYGSVEKHYDFFIQDGTGSSAIVRNFFDGYKIKSQGPPETEYIYSEHDGYKTIAFLQSKIERNQISFIYNNRFRITLEGPDGVDSLWSYIDFENLKKLDKYQ